MEHELCTMYMLARREARALSSGGGWGDVKGLRQQARGYSMHCGGKPGQIQSQALRGVNKGWEEGAADAAKGTRAGGRCVGAAGALI